jgi:tRNA (cytidine/uridine-2'-O-)-methyltransferase
MKPRLRAPAPAHPLHVVLVEPEIPQNTGNIARLTAATGSHLHLVRPLGFSIDEKAVRRAGVDYWHLVKLSEHENFAAFQSAHRQAIAGVTSDAGIWLPGIWLLSATAKRSYLDVAFQPGDALVFGRESVGLSATMLEEHPERCIGIPTLGAVRSLNLANAAAIVVYEALRQIGALRHTFVEGAGEQGGAQA